MKKVVRSGVAGNGNFVNKASVKCNDWIRLDLDWIWHFWVNDLITILLNNKKLLLFWIFF